jgi:ATP-binding cassette, subfamily B, bacterial PglK
MAMIIIAGVLLISYFLLYSSKNKIAIWGKESSDAHTEMIRLINHGMGGLKETRVIGCESYFEQKMESQIDKYSISSSLALSFTNLPRYVIEAFLITFLVTFTFAFLSTNQGNVKSLSSILGIFALASIRLLPAIGNLLSSINGIKYHAYSMDKIYMDLKELEGLGNTTPIKVIGNAKKTVASFRKSVLLENVTYRYPGANRSSLQDIFLEIKKGDSIGLIGKSGAGKTTLVDTILGLLTPQSGDIKVDGKSVYTDIRAWQNLIGYVPQSIFLMDDTLEKNIAFGIPEHLIDQDKLRKAVAASQLDSIVEQLPNGLHTPLGERGVMLSGGQRQRVGIARALYHEREILVFDEATASLDSETESLVTEAIRSLSGIKTMIIIAHRLSTLEYCDRICVLEKGQIVSSGSYQDIILDKQTQPVRPNVLITS